MAAIEFNNQKMDAIIREARACGASDIHISEGMQTRYRVHGRLVQAQTQYSADETAELLQSMMNEKQKNISQTETMPTLRSAHRTDAASVSMYFASRKK